jgi:hypothetical protein
MYKIDHVAGRLVEVRLATPLSLDEVHQFALEYKQKAGAIHGKYVGVVDITHATLFPAPVAEALIQLLSRAAEHVERTAILVGEGANSATFAMQVERIIRNAASPNRRAFRRVDELREWLREVLTVEERVRLARFLVESA